MKKVQKGKRNAVKNYLRVKKPSNYATVRIELFFVEKDGGFVKEFALKDGKRLSKKKKKKQTIYIDQS